MLSYRVFNSSRMTDMPRLLAALAAALLACAVAPEAGAQAWPARSVRVLVPYPPGGTADLLARVLGAKLSESLGQPFVIENRAGAGGNLAAEATAKAAPDGYTLLMANAPVLAVNPSLYDKVPFDPVKDFAPVSLVANVPLLLVTHPSFAPKSVSELIALAKAQGGKLNYASAGGGSTTYLATELFKSMAGVQMLAIPYKGSGPALSALVAGEVPVMFELFPSALGHVKSGRIRALAVTSAARSPLMPELPTVAEAGLPGYEIASWFGFVAPAGTPREVVTKLNTEIVKLIATPEMHARLATLGAEPRPSTPEQFSQLIPAEIRKWAKVIKDSGARVE
jgi:tripartite-type tricarboxylate transporter receptor subunit TctC